MAAHDETRDPGYETRDIPAAVPYEVVVFMTVFIPLGLAIVWIVMVTVWRESTAPEPPFDEEPYESQGPHLQADPISEYQAYRNEMERRLGSVGWVNREAGIVHLPIERAQQLLIERGLPQYPGEPEPTGPAVYDRSAATQWLDAPSSSEAAAEDRQ